MNEKQKQLGRVAMFILHSDIPTDYKVTANELVGRCIGNEQYRDALVRFIDDVREVYEFRMLDIEAAMFFKWFAFTHPNIVPEPKDIEEFIARFGGE